MPMVYEFDERMAFVNNYTLMDVNAYTLKKEDPSLSYNNISIDKYKIVDDYIRMEQAQKELELDGKSSHSGLRYRYQLKTHNN